MSDAADRIEGVVEHAAETAAAIVEGEQLDAAAVVEAAADRVEAAEEIAEEMAAAMLITNLGQSVAQTNERLDQWHREQSETIQSLQNLVTTLREELDLLKASTQPSLPVLLTPAQSSENNQSPVTEAETLLEAEIVEPAEKLVAVAVAPVAPPKEKRTRWI